MNTVGLVELRKEYRKWVGRFWEKSTRLAQIVTEDFPDPDDLAARPTRGQVDAMRDLALRIAELSEGYDAGAN